jgi:hypothetical protein
LFGDSKFQPVNDPSEPAVIEEVDEALRAYFTAASELQLTNPAEVQDAIRGLRVDKTPGPNGIPNRALKHNPQRAIFLLVNIFNAALLSCHFVPTWKHARVIPILKPGKDLAQSSSFRFMSHLDTTGKLSEKILLTRIFSEVSGRKLPRDELFEFRPKHSTPLAGPPR